jgi:hypothetical protein
MNLDTVNTKSLLQIKHLILILIAFVMSSCRLVDGQDSGSLSQASVILNTMVISAACADKTNVAESYSCQPTVKIPSDQSKSAQLTWALAPQNTCSWLQINPTTGQVFGTPSLSDSKTCVLSFQVRTTKAPSSDYSIAVQISGPVISLSKQNCSTTVGVQSPLNCTIVATSNLTNSIYTYSLASDNTCSWINIDPSSGQLSGTPTVANEGACSLSVNAALANLSSGNIKIPISVPAIAVTVTPVLCPSSAPIQSGYSCTLRGSSSLPGHTITWSLDAGNTCSWASIDSASGTITGSPPLSAQGNCSLSVTANLENLAMGNFSTTITIPAIPINVAMNCNAMIAAGATFTCQPSASVTIQNPVFTWALSPQNTCRWASISASSGLISGTPAIEGVGPCVLGITASLGKSAASQSITAMVGIAGYGELELGSSSDPTGAHAGSSVAISGTSAVVGSPDKNNADGSAGVVNIYTNNGVTWQRTATLNPPDSSMKSFGYSVAISGSTIMIGAPASASGGNSVGAVVIYQLSGSLWNYAQTVLPPPQLGTSLVNFGSDVHIDVGGTTAIVGTSHFTVDAAFILQKTSIWSVGAPLTFDAVASYNGSGRIKVSIENSIAVVADNQSKTVHVFRNTAGNWLDEATLTAGSPGNQFAGAVTVGGGRILVGASSENFGAGAAYLFEYGSSWINTATFSAIDSFSNQLCGSSVALTATTAVMGCPASFAAGSAYVFSLNNNAWNLSSKFLSIFGPSTADAFGSSLAISGTNIIVGADLLSQSSSQSSSGAAFIMNKN